MHRGARLIRERRGLSDGVFFPVFFLPQTKSVLGLTNISLPEFMNFKLFGKTILVVNITCKLFLNHPLSQ